MTKRRTIGTLYSIMHRFFVTNKDSAAPLIITDLEQVHQIKNVLKLHETEQIVIVPGDGTELVCEIISIGKKDISLGLIEKRTNTAEPKRQVALYCAVLKRDNFEWVVAKATECGVLIIVPITTDHTVKLGLNEERLRKIMIEAVEQSGRGKLPELRSIISFEEAVSEAKEQDVVLFFEQTDKLFSPKDVATAKRVALFIGPEGGWSDAEKLYADSHLIVRSLGARVLRAETAAAVATYNAVQF